MRSVIHVGGTSRSGSTMVHLMLGTSPSAFAVGEALNWFRPAKTHHFKLTCACGRDECDRWSWIRNAQESDFHSVVAEKTGAAFVIDSSKEISWLIDARRWAQAKNMRSVNLFVWKDPIALSYSFWKRGRDLMAWREEFLKYYGRVIEVGLPLLTVALEDILQTPRETLRDVCRAIDLTYVEGMERFWEAEHHHLFGSYGVRRQVQLGDSYIQPETTFSDEFLPFVPDLRERVGTDREVQELIAELRKHDVSTDRQTGATSDREIRLRTPYPFWYYGQRAKRMLRRYKPQVKDLRLTRSVATIPFKDLDDHGKS